MIQSGRLLKLLWGIGISGIFLLLTLLFFYPCLSQINSAIIGPPEDNTFFLWFQWYGSRALWNPALEFFHTRLMYYPEGIGLWYANYFYSGVAIAGVLQPLFGFVASYNLVVLISFVLAGVFTYFFLMELTQSRAASIYGAYVFAFSPLHFAHALHHPTVASVQYIPLFLLFMIRAHRQGGAGNRIIAGAMLALSAYSDWNYLIYGGLCLAASYPWTAWSQRKVVSARGVWNLIGVGGSALLITAPVMVPMIFISMKQPAIGADLPGHNVYVADLLGYLVPHAYHSMANMDWIKNINKSMTGTQWEKAVYLGWVNLALAASACLVLRRRVIPYLAGFIIFVILALGVELHVGGNLTGIALPYSVFEHLPFLKHARNPSRTMAFGYAFWAILVAFGIQGILRTVKSPRLKYIALAMCMGLGFMDFYSLCSDVTPVVLPPAYGPIMQDPGYAKKEFAIMNIPWDKGRYMMEQTIHGLPEMQGYVGRKFSVPLIGRLPFDNLPLQREILKKNKVKYVLVRKKRMTWDPSRDEEVRIHSEVAKIARMYSRGYARVYEDDSDAVFKVY